MMSLSYLSLPGAVVPLYILKKTHISSSFNLISNYLNGGQFALLIISLLYIQADMVPETWSGSGWLTLGKYY